MLQRHGAPGSDRDHSKEARVADKARTSINHRQDSKKSWKCRGGMRRMSIEVTSALRERMG